MIEGTFFDSELLEDLGSSVRGAYLHGQSACPLLGFCHSSMTLVQSARMNLKEKHEP